MEKHDLAVYITDGQPLTKLDQENIEFALAVANRTLIIIGSANRYRSASHPFGPEEILQALEVLVPDSEARLRRQEVQARPLEDYSYNDPQWVEKVQEAVLEFIGPGPARVALIASPHHRKFPQWESVTPVPNVDWPFPPKKDLLAAFYSDEPDQMLFWDNVPAKLFKFYKKFRDMNPVYDLCQEEFSYYKTYDPKKYDVTMVTTDAVVVCAGHVLMVTRKFAPGKGTLALPGGFLNQREWVNDGIIRELREETKIDVAPQVLRAALKEVRHFDDPFRSDRGRVITFAGLIQLDPHPGLGLPKVKGSDDAKKAQWVPLARLMDMRGQVFEDHLDIIQEMTRVR